MILLGSQLKKLNKSTKNGKLARELREGEAYDIVNCVFKPCMINRNCLVYQEKNIYKVLTSAN